MMTETFSPRTDTEQKKIQGFAFNISIVLCLFFGVFFVVSGLPKFQQGCEIELEHRINPNEAEVASLVRLPGIGPAKADAIVSYRVNMGAGGVFKSSADLQRVRGIGPKTVQAVEKWLKF